MGRILIFDTSGLLAIRNAVHPNDLNELFEELTKSVENGRAGFPKEVADELKKYYGTDEVTRWATGLGKCLRAYAGGYEYWVAMMEAACELGYDEGIASPDGSEPVILHVVAAICRLNTTLLPACCVSEDVGSHPSRPTMEELCPLLEIEMIDTRTALSELGLDSFTT